MRTAILVSGHLRTALDCGPTLVKWLANPLDADIFVSTWDTSGFVTSKDGGSYLSVIETEVTEDTVKSIYGERIKGVNVESQKTLSNNFMRANLVNPFSKKRNKTHVSWADGMSWLMPRIYSMWHKVLDANRLRKEHGDYDLIIRCRPDLHFNTGLPDISLDEKTLYLPLAEIYRGWNDQFAFGTQKVMDAYCGIYEEFLDKLVSQNVDISNCAEYVIKHFCDANSLKKASVKFNYILQRRPKRIKLYQKP
jgi:hypothetical protein